MNQPYSFAQRAEALLVRLLVGLLSVMPITLASWLGGTIAGFVGPFLSVSRKVGDVNLCAAMPELSAQERQKIIHQVWTNLGQTVAELPKLKALSEVLEGSCKPGYILEGWEENVQPYLVPGKPAIFFTGHLANWEIMPVIADARGVDFGFMYRAASNPIVDQTLKNLRHASYSGVVKMFPKGAAGGRAAYAHLSRGAVLGLLVDQKLDTGLPVPFFGRTAMTMDALASFVLKFRCPAFPVYVQRLGPGRLKVICEPQLTVPQTGERRSDLLALTTEMNRTLERWIKARPGEWLWLHKRWPS